jgi:hypothetical protein
VAVVNSLGALPITPEVGVALKKPEEKPPLIEL